MKRYCQNCGQELPENANVCLGCGQFVPGNGDNVNGSQKSKMAAGLLGIFLGAWGIHNFYLGNTGRGVLQIVLTICTCGIAGIWGLIEGILILTGSINKDANGIPLKD